MLISHIARKTLVIPILMSILSSSLGQSATRKGTYDMDCQGYTFHLASGHDAAAKDKLTLRLQWHLGLYPPAWEAAGWNDITAKRCGSSAECEDAMQAQIRFETIRKRIIGGFRVQFANEHQQEGTFNVKYRHQGPRVICE